MAMKYIYIFLKWNPLLDCLVGYPPKAELKHGRVAMLATVGWIATDLGLFDTRRRVGVKPSG